MTYEIFRMDKQTGRYKGFMLQQTENGIFLTATQGIRGLKDKREQITVKLSLQELSLLGYYIQHMIRKEIIKKDVEGEL